MSLPANKHKVPKKQWNGWSVGARNIFNEMYESVLQQEFYKHPKAALIAAKQWTTTAWNTAWTAASMHDEANRDWSVQKPAIA